jgi:hypothetical protein
MLVNESISSFLKPKPYDEILKEVPKMTKLEKENILWNRGLEHFGGSYTDLADFLYNKKVWKRIKDSWEYYGNKNIVEAKHFKASEIVELFLTNMTEEELDIKIKILWPEYSNYVSEGVADTFKPKSQEEINNSLQDILDLTAIKQKLDSFSMGHLLCLYVWEPDWETCIYSKNVDYIQKEMLTYFMEAYKEDYRRDITVYRIKTDENGSFTSEGRGPGSNGGVHIMFEISLTQTYEEFAKVELNIWD